MIKLATYHFTGTPKQIGLAHGEELRNSIQGFVEVRLDAAVKYFQEQGIKDKSIIKDLRETGKKCYALFSNWDPEGLIEHNAIASAAGVDPADLYTITNYTDVRDAYMLSGNSPDAEGCSALMIPASRTSGNSILAGQTWDLNPEDIDYVIAVHVKPNKGPSRWSIQLAGCLSLMGMNSDGLTLGTTNLKTWDSKPGIGYINLIHKALRCSTMEEATSVLTQAQRAGAHSYLLTSKDKAIRFETTSFDYDIQTMEDSPMGWTNHCLNPRHQAKEYQPPSSSSLQRLQRLNTLLTSGTFDVEAIKTIFANREDGTNSINRYPDDDDYAATNACMITDPANMQIHACRGPANKGEWQVLDFNQ